MLIFVFIRLVFCLVLSFHQLDGVGRNVAQLGLVGEGYVHCVASYVEGTQKRPTVVGATHIQFVLFYVLACIYYEVIHFSSTVVPSAPEYLSGLAHIVVEFVASVLGNGNFPFCMLLAIARADDCRRTDGLSIEAAIGGHCPTHGRVPLGKARIFKVFVDTLLLYPF